MAYSPLKRARSTDMAADGDVRTSYTSEFLESVNDLPVELRKCYSLIKDLDEYVHEMVDGRPSPETPGVEEMKKVMLNKVTRPRARPAPPRPAPPRARPPPARAPPRPPALPGALRWGRARAGRRRGGSTSRARAPWTRAGRRS